MYLTVLFYSLIGGVFSLIGGALLLSYKKITQKVLIHLSTFAAGALLGAAFLELLPEVFEIGEQINLAVDDIAVAILAGIIGFFLLERLLLRFHGHTHEHLEGGHIEKTPWLLIIGDSLHNFADGVAIATAYLSDPSLGLVTTLAVAAHEVPSEIGEFSVMLQAGWSRRRVFITNVISALMATVGATFAYLSQTVIAPAVPWILALTIGIFIYIAMADLIPEINHRTRQDKASHVLTLLLLGIVVVGFIGRLVE